MSSLQFCCSLFLNGWQRQISFLHSTSEISQFTSPPFMDSFYSVELCVVSTQVTMYSMLCRMRVFQCRSIQNPDCRLQTKYKLQTAGSVQNTHWEIIKTVFMSNTWQHVILWLYSASWNRFSMVIFPKHLHYCGMLLAIFLITLFLPNFKPSYQSCHLSLLKWDVSIYSKNSNTQHDI